MPFEPSLATGYSFASLPASHLPKRAGVAKDVGMGRRDPMANENSPMESRRRQYSSRSHEKLYV